MVVSVYNYVPYGHTRELHPDAFIRPPFRLRRTPLRNCFLRKLPLEGWSDRIDPLNVPVFSRLQTFVGLASPLAQLRFLDGTTSPTFVGGEGNVRY
jgi:hypothetical protein